MKKILVLLAFAFGILTHQQCHSALIIATTQTTDDGVWPSLPDGYYPHGEFYGPNGYYDAFSVRVNGTPGEAINSLSFGFAFSGNFDDSIAFDLDGDGVIDWTGDYYDVSVVKWDYAPWSSLADAANTKVYLNIGPTGSSVTLKVYGQTVTQGVSTNPENNLVNNINAFTLSSLGLPSIIPGSGFSTLTNPIRVGFVNTNGEGSGIPSINTSDFFTGDGSTVVGPTAVSEPGQVAASLLLLTGIGGYVLLKRRKSAKTALAAA